MFHWESSVSKQAYDFKGRHIGTFDGEFLYDMSGKIALRVDGDEAQPALTKPLFRSAASPVSYTLPDRD